MTSQLLTLFLAMVMHTDSGVESTPPVREVNMTFHASFDGDANASVARGDRRIFTAPSYEERAEARPGILTPVVRLSENGKSGGALEFTSKSKQVILFRATENIRYSKDSLRGTVSFWLKLDPATDLEPGYCDPLQITDKKWNDSSFFVDFTDKNPRDFRLGVFSDYSFWNPKNIEWDKIDDSKRPMVTVKSPPFRRTQWTHVAFTFDAINGSGPADVKLFINGQPVGKLERSIQISWEIENTFIMIGLNYVGFFDELAVFDQPLSGDQIRELMSQGVSAFSKNQ